MSSSIKQIESQFYLEKTKGVLVIAGRPPGSTNKPPKSPNSKRQNDKPILQYTCTKCGSKYEDPVGHFFMSKTSPLFVSNSLRSTVCCNCINELFEDAKNIYHDAKLALIIICHYLDVYFSEDLYESVKGNANFSVGNYLKLINGSQYKAKNFTTSLVYFIKEGLKSDSQLKQEKETKWTQDEISNKNIAINMIGYDPFEGYSETDRRFLFNELIKYFDENIEDDTWKLSQIIQIVNNNNQIRNYDLIITSMSSSSDSLKNADSIKTLQAIKKSLVDNNDKIAKENEISVKNRSNKEVGKSSLGKLQIKLRKLNFKDAEENYYKQLRSEGTQWAIDMSHKSIKENGMFDENDKQEIFIIQRERLISIQQKLDDEKENNRLLQAEIDSLKISEVNQ